MTNDTIIKHLEDIDQVMCDNQAHMGNISTHLSRIAFALEALVEQGKAPTTTKPKAEKTEQVKKPVKEKAVKSDEPPFEAEKEEPAPEQSKTYTHDDLKQACLTSARADSANRDKLKALLKSYGAVKAVDVPADKLAEVIGKIEAGEF